MTLHQHMQQPSQMLVPWTPRGKLQQISTSMLSAGDNVQHCSAYYTYTYKPLPSCLVRESTMDATSLNVMLTISYCSNITHVVT